HDADRQRERGWSRERDARTAERAETVVATAVLATGERGAVRARATGRHLRKPRITSAAGVALRRRGPQRQVARRSDPELLGRGSRAPAPKVARIRATKRKCPGDGMRRLGTEGLRAGGEGLAQTRNCDAKSTGVDQHDGYAEETIKGAAAEKHGGA